MQAAGGHLAYAAAMHDGTPVQGLPDGMHGRTLAWDSPADGLAIGPDGASPTHDIVALHSPCACVAHSHALSSPAAAVLCEICLCSGKERLWACVTLPAWHAELLISVEVWEARHPGMHGRSRSK